MSVLIGEVVVRFWNGSKFKFERVDTGKWKCIYREQDIVPQSIIEELGA